MKTAITRVAAAVVLFGTMGVSPVLAGLLDNCNTYAQASAKQQQENVLRKCGQSGPNWTTDLNKHLAYCKSVPPQKWKAELQSRAASLQACK